MPARQTRRLYSAKRDHGVGQRLYVLAQRALAVLGIAHRLVAQTADTHGDLVGEPRPAIGAFAEVA